ncbi:GPW/gp25 family protein [Niabella hibiscisoli]|uniref:GPW/gp25 family protein n=1 Tax=Niabella hibiscisoli TaxID=1825928 RepID=UPI001F10D01E|nr:GPW/gp25 family protein [Niabella hibiscisoli]MCH5721012.1 GPW/gp25 family protein [Niabella hibiscisoli]
MNFQNYYKLPLDLGSITAKKILPKCSQKESIAHHLHLILTTSFGELLSDVQYGSSLWDEDFDNVSYRNKQKEHILRSIASTIAIYETRIEKVKVEMNVMQEEIPDRTTDPRMKRKLDF